MRVDVTHYACSACHPQYCAAFLPHAAYRGLAHSGIRISFTSYPCISVVSYRIGQCTEPEVMMFHRGEQLRVPRCAPRLQ